MSWLSKISIYILAIPAVVEAPPGHVFQRHVVKIATAYSAKTCIRVPQSPHY